MRVGLCTADAQLHIEHSLYAEFNLRRTARILEAALPVEAVTAQQLPMLLSKLLQMGTTGLLLPLNEELDSAGDGAMHLLPGIHCADFGGNPILIVHCPTGENSSVPDGGGVGGIYPGLQRLHWLDIVVVVKAERPGAFPRQSRIQDWIAAGGVFHRLSSDVLQRLLYHLYHLRDTLSGDGYAGLPAKALQ